MFLRKTKARPQVLLRALELLYNSQLKARLTSRLGCKGCNRARWFYGPLAPLLAFALLLAAGLQSGSQCKGMRRWAV